MLFDPNVVKGNQIVQQLLKSWLDWNDWGKGVLQNQVTPMKMMLIKVLIVIKVMLILGNAQRKQFLLEGVP